MNGAGGGGGGSGGCRFQPDSHGYNIWSWWRAGWLLVTLTYFSRSLRDLNCQIWAKRCLCAHYLINQLADSNQICMDIIVGHDKMLSMYWWPWSNFQGVFTYVNIEKIIVMSNLTRKVWLKFMITNFFCPVYFGQGHSSAKWNKLREYSKYSMPVVITSNYRKLSLTSSNLK